MDTLNMLTVLKYKYPYVKAIFEGEYEIVSPGLEIKPYLHQ
jgi:hypothetical protein